MKKFFLLVLTLLLVCGSVFATITSTAEALLSLDLTGKESIVHVGFGIGDNPTPSAITSTTPEFNYSEVGGGNEYVISLNQDADKELRTADTSFYVFWYLNALKGTGGSSLSLTFDCLKGGSETIEYKITYTADSADYEGIEPATSTEAVLVGTGGQTVEIFTNNTRPGLSRGSLTFTIKGFDYYEVSAQKYTAKLSLNIVAP